jgi:hypothetical protein
MRSVTAREGRRERARPRRRRRALVALAALIVAALVALVLAIESARVPPRELARYLERRASGHDPWLVSAVRDVATLLREMDRGSGVAGLPTFGAGAKRTPSAVTAPSGGGPVVRAVRVTDAQELRAAIEGAAPGDVIALAPGVYRFAEGAYVAVERPGRDDAPITVRAEAPGTATVELSIAEGIRVIAPNWTFEGLDIRGACAEPARCDHAFHVTGAARRFVARDNVVTDFNAHFKINGEGGRFPDDGRIEGNTLRNTAVRMTLAPVTPIDMVAVDGWIVRRNLIVDFAKGQGDRISFGAYAKGAGTGNRFEENVVICESRVRGEGDQRIGLSLGGGGTERAFCRDGRCVAEQFGGVLAANVIASCSDDGIYLNRAAGSRVTLNRLLDTAGIAARYAETTADMQGNVIDGMIRARDDALIRGDDNVETAPLLLYLGLHPQRRRIADLGSGDRDDDSPAAPENAN